MAMLVTRLVLLGALFLAVHHYMIHSDLSGGDRLFQLSDVRSHEVWIVGLLALALGLSCAKSNQFDRYPEVSYRWKRT